MTSVWYTCHKWHQQPSGIAYNRLGRGESSTAADKTESRLADRAKKTRWRAEQQIGQRKGMEMLLGEDVGLIYGTSSKKVGLHCFRLSSSYV